MGGGTDWVVKSMVERGKNILEKRKNNFFSGCRDKLNKKL